ncbi:hypothetical protein Dimus_019296 [Dionaea muscipula]
MGNCITVRTIVITSTEGKGIVGGMCISLNIHLQVLDNVFGRGGNVESSKWRLREIYTANRIVHMVTVESCKPELPSRETRPGCLLGWLVQFSYFSPELSSSQGTVNLPGVLAQGVCSVQLDCPRAHPLLTPRCLSGKPVWLAYLARSQTVISSSSQLIYRYFPLAHVSKEIGRIGQTF